MFKLTKMFLNLVEYVHRPGSVQEINGQAILAEAPRPADAMQVGLTVCLAALVHWQVKVHDNSDLLDVNSCGKE